MITETTRDVFICHASEDKQRIVEPLLVALDDAGISYSYDREILWGDSVSEWINRGLIVSRFVIVIISKVFLEKPWPKKELYSSLVMETSSGIPRVLPLLVGRNAEIETILHEFPLLRDKRYMTWENGLEGIIQELRRRLSAEEGTGGKGVPPSTADIAIPVVRRKITQRQKDEFLRESFTEVREYFVRGLKEVAKQPHLSSDINDIDSRKFITTIYVDGEIANRCKIWIGGFSNEDSIQYVEGRSLYDNDSSINESLSVVSDGPLLGFMPLFGDILNIRNYSERILKADQAAEILWKKFIESIQ